MVITRLLAPAKYLFPPAALEKEAAVNEKKSQPPSIFSNSNLLPGDSLNRYFGGQKHRFKAENRPRF